MRRGRRFSMRSGKSSMSINGAAVMKRIFALAVLGLLVSSAAVAQKTNIDWDRQANFSQYHTYMWQPSPHPAKGFWDQRIVDAVDKQLQAKGLTKVDSNPDLWVCTATAFTSRRNWSGRATITDHIGAGEVGVERQPFTTLG